VSHRKEAGALARCGLQDQLVGEAADARGVAAGEAGDNVECRKTIENQFILTKPSGKTG